MAAALTPGTHLDDWTLPHGWVREVVAVTSGKMPTPIDLSSPMRGSATESCALHGGPAQWSRELKPKGKP